MHSQIMKYLIFLGQVRLIQIYQHCKLMSKLSCSANETDSDQRLWLDKGNIFHVLRINFTRVSLVEENLDFLDDDEIDQSREILNNLYCKQTEIYARL